jgi:hypothetical protein
MYGCVTDTAPNNTSVGYFTLPYSSVTCTIAIGNNSMIGATGDSHIAIGVSIANPTGGTGCNIAIGNRIGGGNFQNSAQNVVIGQYATCTCLTGSSKNVILGANAALALDNANNNVVIGYGVAPPAIGCDCTLAIGYDTGCHWITGTSTKAIKPGAGIIDCADSCGTTGQVLSSVGNAICWITPAGASAATPSVSGTVFGCANATNAVIGSGAFAALTTGTCNSGIGVAALPALTSGCYNIALGDSGGSTITTGCYNIAIGSGQSVTSPTGNCQLAIGPQLGFSWLTGDSTLAIKPGAGLIDSTNSCGTVGQVLTSTGSNALQWATPQTSPFITYTTSAVSYTTGTPLLVAKWFDGTMQGTLTLDLAGYGGINQMWDFYLSGQSTNYNTGWYQTASYPASSSDPLSQGTWYVDFPVYPSPDANVWMIYFSPSQNSLNPSTFTFFYRLFPGSSTPAFQI